MLNQLFLTLATIAVAQAVKLAGKPDDLMDDHQATMDTAAKVEATRQAGVADGAKRT